MQMPPGCASCERPTFLGWLIGPTTGKPARRAAPGWRIVQLYSSIFSPDNLTPQLPARPHSSKRAACADATRMRFMRASNILGLAERPYDRDTFQESCPDWKATTICLSSSCLLSMIKQGADSSRRLPVQTPGCASCGRQISWEWPSGPTTGTPSRRAAPGWRIVQLYSSIFSPDSHASCNATTSMFIYSSGRAACADAPRMRFMRASNILGMAERPYDRDTFQESCPRVEDHSAGFICLLSGQPCIMKRNHQHVYLQLREGCLCRCAQDALHEGVQHPGNGRAALRQGHLPGELPL